MRILAINPGSTSTKIAVYENENLVWEQTIRHSAEELAPYHNISDQYDFRKQLILEELNAAGIPLDFRAIVGRGGLLKPIPGGVFEVNEKMKSEIRTSSRQHASNLGGLIASELASVIPGCKAYIADAVVTDELDDIARVTGLPQVPKTCIFHALNQKAVARKHADKIGIPYEELNLVVAHLGGGISVGAHKKGLIVDVNNALDGTGPFSPERAGTLQAAELVSLCFSGKYTQDEIRKLLCGKGGLMAHFGNTHVGNLLKEAQAGNKEIETVLKAMFYNVGKEIGAMCAALKGEVDAILITGGIAYNTSCMEDLKQQVGFLAPVHIYPGEDELEALALNGLRVLRGEITPKEYV